MATGYRSRITGGHDGFGPALRAEWTKLRSVRSTVFTLGAAVVLTIALSALASSGSSTDANEGPNYTDAFHFVHQPLAGDGTVTARVVSQVDSHEWAKAGVMIKESTTSGADYAAVLVTPQHGARMQVNFDTEVAGPAGPLPALPRWLRVTRAGDTVSGYVSTDGSSWQQIGTATLALPPTAQVGLFVSSPPTLRTERGPGSTTISGVPTTGKAVFDSVRIEPPAAAGQWRGLDVAPPPPGPVPTPSDPAPAGGFTEAAGTFTVTGTGEVAALPPGGDDDMVMNALIGVLIGLMAIVALGVLFATSEFKTGIVRTTFTANPRRGRVLAAKATVLGATTFVAGLVAGAGALLVSLPILRGNGYQPPAYPTVSLADQTPLRAVFGAALFLTALALFSLGVGTVLRSSAGGIAVVIALVLVPHILSSLLVSLTAAKWAKRLTPNAGFSIMETRERFDTALSPWAGFAVLCAYAVAALGLAFWALRRRDA